MTCLSKKRLRSPWPRQERPVPGAAPAGEIGSSGRSHANLCWCERPRQVVPLGLLGNGASLYLMLDLSPILMAWFDSQPENVPSHLESAVIDYGCLKT